MQYIISSTNLNGSELKEQTLQLNMEQKHFYRTTLC